MIYIPNYKNNKPKIIRMADLTRLNRDANFKSGDATVKNSHLAEN